jgi:hypothetical protein
MKGRVIEPCVLGAGKKPQRLQLGILFFGILFHLRRVSRQGTRLWQPPDHRRQAARGKKPVATGDRLPQFKSGYQRPAGAENPP